LEENLLAKQFHLKPEPAKLHRQRA
jgi:hypothetical protein